VAVPCGGGISKKAGRDVLHGVEAEPIALGGVQGPHHCPNHVSINIFRNRNSIGAVERMPGASQGRRRRIHIVIGIVWVTDEGNLWDSAAECVSEDFLHPSPKQCRLLYGS